jgi:hypothetical protein
LFKLNAPNGRIGVQQGCKIVHKIQNEKKYGYALLSIGLIMMFMSVYLMINVFTGRRSPPVLVHFSDISIPIGSSEQETTVFLVSGQTMDQLTAMGFWYILMFFIMFAGGRIASLGINLIKEKE